VTQLEKRECQLI